MGSRNIASLNINVSKGILDFVLKGLPLCHAFIAVCDPCHWNWKWEDVQNSRVVTAWKNLGQAFQ